MIRQTHRSKIIILTVILKEKKTWFVTISQYFKLSKESVHFIVWHQKLLLLARIFTVICPLILIINLLAAAGPSCHNSRNWFNVHDVWRIPKSKAKFFYLFIVFCLFFILEKLSKQYFYLYPVIIWAINNVKGVVGYNFCDESIMCNLRKFNSYKYALTHTLTHKNVPTNKSFGHVCYWK